MTLKRSRNSHSGLHICGRFMISWPTIFLPDGAFTTVKTEIFVGFANFCWLQEKPMENK
jgi:hypothetical protein